MSNILSPESMNFERKETFRYIYIFLLGVGRIYLLQKMLFDRDQIQHDGPRAYGKIVETTGQTH